MRKISGTLLLAIMMSAPSSVAFDLAPGSPFPDIPLPLTDGEELASISDFRGEKLMLHLFASW